VSATLARPDGGTLELRLVDGVPYRPVLAPGGWRPCTETEFRAAAAGNAAWADDPFKLRPSLVASPRSVSETPAVAVPLRPGDAESRDKAVTDALVRAGRLVAIDGVVHRASSEPTIALVATQIMAAVGTPMPKHARFELVWRLADGLAMDADQRTMLTRSTRAKMRDANLAGLSLSRIEDMPGPR
jgi:hypothetical protein